MTHKNNSNTTTYNTPQAKTIHIPTSSLTLGPSKNAGAEVIKDIAEHWVHHLHHPGTPAAFREPYLG